MGHLTRRLGSVRPQGRVSGWEIREIRGLVGDILQKGWVGWEEVWKTEKRGE